MVDLFKKHGYKMYFDVDDNAAKILPSKPYINPKNVDLILCGYDAPSIDKTGIFLKSIKSFNIPVLAILDSWKGIDRFWYEDGSLRQLTNNIAVSDYLSKNYLIDKGVPSDWPVVTGHPGIDYISECPKKNREKFRINGRLSLGLQKRDKVLMFLSEPINFINGNQSSLLYMNTKANQSIVDWVESNYSQKYKIVVRHHPIEKKKIPANWINGNEISLEEAIFSSDLILGLSSTTIQYAIAAQECVYNLEKIISGWIPEYSNMPKKLWKSLSENNFIENKSNHKINNKIFSKGSSKKILTLISRLIKENY